MNPELDSAELTEGEECLLRDLGVGCDCCIGPWKILVSGAFTSALSPFCVTAMAAAGAELQLCTLSHTLGTLGIFWTAQLPHSAFASSCGPNHWSCRRFCAQTAACSP